MGEFLGGSDGPGPAVCRRRLAAALAVHASMPSTSRPAELRSTQRFPRPSCPYRVLRLTKHQAEGKEVGRSDAVTRKERTGDGDDMVEGRTGSGLARVALVGSEQDNPDASKLARAHFIICVLLSRSR